MSLTFKLRPQARFADGSPVTSEDVVFTFNALKSKGHPTYGILMRDIVKAEALDKAQVERAAELTENGALRLWPHRHATDGFFAAVWQKKD